MKCEIAGWSYLGYRLVSTCYKVNPARITVEVFIGPMTIKELYTLCQYYDSEVLQLMEPEEQEFVRGFLFQI